MLRPPEGLLARFTRDLTAEARAGRLEPVRCRAPEIERVVDILLRHGKNNPALVGSAGVGKTAIVEGLAQRIAAGNVPLVLRDVRLLAVDHVALLAGTTYRGQYEERIQLLVDETSASPDIVLFIDELHNLIGQGTAVGATMDAANMLKPALVRGDFRVIGATTDDEYERYVCADPALERRFQKVAVRELSAEETLDILKARVLRLERHHNVVIAEEALHAAIELTDAWVTDRMRPDRAIDVLDEACAHTQALAQYAPDTERLLIERREALRAGAGAPAPDAARDARRAAHGHEDAHADAGDEEAGADGTPLPLDRMARDGMAALGRFGAELEAMFAAAPGRERPEAAPDRARAARPERAATTADRNVLVELDVVLAHRLMAEGLVVRGHDVARVVGVAVNATVRWPV